MPYCINNLSCYILSVKVQFFCIAIGQKRITCWSAKRRVHSKTSFSCRQFYQIKDETDQNDNIQPLALEIISPEPQTANRPSLRDASSKFNSFAKLIHYSEIKLRDEGHVICCNRGTWTVVMVTMAFELENCSCHGPCTDNKWLSR